MVELVSNVVAVIADGYSFNTNLDSDPPADGNAPETQQELFTRALDASWPWDVVERSLSDYEKRRG